MEDRYKFRGMKDGVWYYGAYFKHLPYTPYCCSGKTPEKDYKHLIIQDGFSDWGLPREMTGIEVEPKTIGQCTGLHDKNGKLIYELDYVKYNNKEYKIKIDKFLGITLTNILNGDVIVMDDIILFNCEVISNEFERNTKI